MRLFLVTILMSFTFAQEISITLEEAVEHVSLITYVASAQATLEAAERDLARLRADPLILRLPKVQAVHEAENARSGLGLARFNARIELTRAYYRALEAEDSLHLTQLQLEIMRTTSRATELRFEAGAATRLDVGRARDDFRAAKVDTANAEAEYDLAFAQLSGLLGVDSDTLTLYEPESVIEIPAFEAILDRLDENLGFQQAEQAVEEARIRYEGINNPLSARLNIVEAQEAMKSAQQRVINLRRSWEFEVRGSYNAVLTAERSLTSALATLSTAEEALEAQRLRFENGNISRLELAQAELEVSSAKAQRNIMQHNLSRSLLQLEQEVRGQNSTMESSAVETVNDEDITSP